MESIKYWQKQLKTMNESSIVCDYQLGGPYICYIYGIDNSGEEYLYVGENRQVVAQNLDFTFERETGTTVTYNGKTVETFTPDFTFLFGEMRKDSLSKQGPVKAIGERDGEQFEVYFNFYDCRTEYGDAFCPRADQIVFCRSC